MNESDLIQTIKNLKSGSRPDSDWVARERALLMQRVNADAREMHAGRFLLWKNMNRGFNTALIGVFVIALMFSGFVALGKEIKVLPGHPFYQAKEISRKAQSTLTASNQAKIELELKFVHERTKEITALVDKSELDSAHRMDTKKINTIKKAVSAVYKNAANIHSKLAQTPERKNISEAAKKVTEESGDIINELESIAITIPEVAPDVVDAKESIRDADIEALKIVVETTGEEEAQKNEIKNLVESKINSLTGETEKLSENIKIVKADIDNIRENIEQARESVEADNFKAASLSVYLAFKSLSQAQRQLLFTNNGKIIQSRDGLGEVKGVRIGSIESEEENQKWAEQGVETSTSTEENTAELQNLNSKEEVIEKNSDVEKKKSIVVPEKSIGHEKVNEGVNDKDIIFTIGR